MFSLIYKFAPVFLQEVMISMFNIKQYNIRYGGFYKKYLIEFKSNTNLSFAELEEIQKNKFKKLIQFSINNANYYNQVFKNINSPELLLNINKLPIASKETIRQNIKEIYTIPIKKGVISKTGGTTGKSLEVIFTKSNMQERFAMLDCFRSNYGYKLGKKTAWFSGKKILTKSDINKNRFWKTDHYYKVRYYSTFHINDSYLNYYIQNIKEYKPEFIVGFPSNIFEIAQYGLLNKIDFPSNLIKAIFPTAETLTNEMRISIETFFKTKVFNQYASSEGAPFIFECINGKLHIEMQSGIFEVLDNNDLPADKGRLIVTSFTTFGTPLIRYDIGDGIELSSESCSCGNNNPIVNQIFGRNDDYIFSKNTGKINLGNISNTLKGVSGIKKFQVIQNKLEAINILIIKDEETFTKQMEKVFINNWRDRVGDYMDIQIQYVNYIPIEKSGKYRLVKNNIKHLLN